MFNYLSHNFYGFMSIYYLLTLLLAYIISTNKIICDYMLLGDSLNWFDLKRIQIKCYTILNKYLNMKSGAYHEQ